MEQHKNDEGAESFESLLEKSISRTARFQPGQTLETYIVSISKDSVFLQLSGKSEGVVDRAEFVDGEGKLTVKEGDPVRAFFLDAKNGEMRFTTKISGEKAGPALLENAYRSKIPVEGLVEKEIKGGYEVKIGESRAFCPYSQMGERRTETPEIYIGKHLTFKIQEYKDNGRSILVSNRAILEEARQVKVEALKKTLKEGAVVVGPIASIQDFGAFIDLDGVQALLPISEIARDRVQDIRSVLSVGQEIEAAVIKIDWSAERITLSLKSLLADPWTQAAQKYPVGSKHTGTVARATDFGAFVSLESGLDGLIHISEFKGGGKYGNSGVPVKTGDTLTVQILSVDVPGKRISLKPTSSLEEDATTKKYLDGEGGGDTYNPFAELLKKKKK